MRMHLQCLFSNARMLNRRAATRLRSLNPPSLRFRRFRIELRQLQLARTITPLVIAQQLRARAVYGGVGHEQLLEEANSLAQGAIDDMASQIERTVDDLYAQARARAARAEGL
eukprot:6214612-Pleurochrysis_carterae.AAC.3